MADQDERQLSFSVDTHLLRELGALLVGRDSTALLELIKNSYDADATVVTVHASGLDGDYGVLTVVDDGNGMTFDIFDEAFLRIAGRGKEGTRVSPRYGRAYTGAKGIGRLAAHKLAGLLTVDSIPDLLFTAVNETASRSKGQDSRSGVHAVLDWDSMEQEYENLDETGNALVASALPVLPGAPTGTSMTLERMREPWRTDRLGPFLTEIRNCRPPAVLVDRLPTTVLARPLLFHSPKVRDHAPDDPGFRLDLTGQLEPGEELWQTLAERADWIVEVDASPTSVRYGVAPTQRRLLKLSKSSPQDWGRSYVFEGAHPNPEDGPFFQARVFATEGSLGTARSELARHNRTDSGIRVYVEGFRVLPYGASGDDWLELDRDYVRRTREFQIQVDDSELPITDDEGLYQLGNRNYYGAVLLTTRGAPKLQALVNREGFVPDPYFQSIRKIVRAGPDLLTRARAALERRIVEARRQQKEAADRQAARDRRLAAAALQASTPIGTAEESSPTVAPDSAGGIAPIGPAEEAPGPNEPQNAFTDIDDLTDLESEEEAEESPGERGLRRLLEHATSSLAELRAEPDSRLAPLRIEELGATLERLGDRMRAMRQDQLTLQTLAGVGTQYTAFVHEVNGLLGLSQALRDLLGRFPTIEPNLSREQQRVLRASRQGADELVQALTRQTSYLTDVIGPDARRRRRRLPVGERVDSALRLLQSRLAERQQTFENLVAPQVTSPPIFPAELAIVLTNLLSNAIKFAGVKGRIRIQAAVDDRATLQLVVENTGVQVDRLDWDRFFRPFESSTTNVDIVLGQGMGLGLPIVRTLLSDYDGTAQFVTPSEGFSTAVEVVLPDPRPSIGLRKR